MGGGALRKHHDHPDQHVGDSGSGVLRASVFGVSDGLVSNMALVMGVAGGTSEGSTVVLAGVAGLLAGAFSMAAGEYVSVRVQREVFERELAVERAHLADHPVDEQAQFRALLEDKGVDPALAAELADAVHSHPERALEFHALLEHGIHPERLGSPEWTAASSFAAFAIGALVPLLPWFFLAHATLPSLVASAIALVAVGGATTRITHQSLWLGAGRQLAIGIGAAGVTYAIGRFVGSVI